MVRHRSSPDQRPLEPFEVEILEQIDEQMASRRRVQERIAFYKTRTREITADIAACNATLRLHRKHREQNANPHHER